MKQTVLAAVLSLAIVVFSIQNAGSVAVSFLFWRMHCSMALLLMIILIAGIILGLMLSAGGLRRKSAALKAADKKIEKLEKDRTRRADDKPTKP